MASSHEKITSLLFSFFLRPSVLFESSRKLDKNGKWQKDNMICFVNNWVRLLSCSGTIGRTEIYKMEYLKIIAGETFISHAVLFWFWCKIVYTLSMSLATACSFLTMCDERLETRNRLSKEEIRKRMKSTRIRKSQENLRKTFISM